jgi:hypothetical protein
VYRAHRSGLLYASPFLLEMAQTQRTTHAEPPDVLMIWFLTFTFGHWISRASRLVAANSIKFTIGALISSHVFSGCHCGTGFQRWISRFFHHDFVLSYVRIHGKAKARRLICLFATKTIGPGCALRCSDSSCILGTQIHHVPFQSGEWWEMRVMVVCSISIFEIDFDVSILFRQASTSYVRFKLSLASLDL